MQNMSIAKNRFDSETWKNWLFLIKRIFNKCQLIVFFSLLI